MRIRELLCCAAFVTCLSPASSSEGGSAGGRVDAKRMAELLQLVEKVEPYSRFLEAEKTAIKDIDGDYIKRRNAYLVELRYVHPNVQSPKKPLEQLTRSCRTNGKFKDAELAKRYVDAAYTLGMELIIDRPSFTVDMADVERAAGLTFAKYADIELKLDLFRPKRRSGVPLACIVCIHGGGWRVHKREWFNGHAAYFAKNGIAAVGVDYRMLPAIKSLRACVEDVKAAVRWVRANAEKYGLDPKRIGAVGGSAGAHLTAMLATTADVKELEGRGGNAEFSSEIQAAVGYATPALNLESPRMRERRRRRKWKIPDPRLISPYVNVDRGSAAMLFIHGTKDKTVPLSDSKDLHAKYQKAGAYSELKILEGKPHVFYTNERAAQWALEFFRKQFGIKGSSRGIPTRAGRQGPLID